MKKIIALALCFLLTACGGGGNSGGASSAALSADQSTFESLILTPNASYGPGRNLPLSGAPTQGTHYFYATPISLALSPLGNGVQSPTAGATVNMSNTPLAIPAASVTRYLVNGAIVTDASVVDRYAYPGTGVKRETIAADGITLLASELRSGLQSVTLSGLVNAAPADFSHHFNALYTNPALLNGTATWASGARYVAYTATNTADRYRVFDSTTVTTGTSPTPVASGTTIAALMAAGGISSTSDSATYTLSNGTVSTVNGVNTYVANALRPNSTTERYRTYYDLNGNVYTGDVTKANAVLGGSSYSETSAGVTTVNYTSKLQLRLNKAAIDSLKAAVTF